MRGSASFFKIKLNIAWILLSRKCCFKIMKITFFWDDLTNNSAGKEALMRGGWHPWPIIRAKVLHGFSLNQSKDTNVVVSSL